MFYIKGSIFDKHGIPIFSFNHPVEITKANKIINDLILKDGL